MFTKRFKLQVIAILSIMLSHIPHIALAEAVVADNQMVSTIVLVDNFSREKAQEKVISYLSKGEVQQKLIENGISPDEAASRVASLSNLELQKLSTQIDQAQYGGDI
ncbi:MAG: PA2779 family protein, partial [Pseudobdellovibrio sp.]